GTLDDDVEVIVGRPLGHQDFALREVAERDNARKCSRLLAGQLGPDLRCAQCLENALLGHDCTPEEGKSPRATGCGSPMSVWSARATKASIRVRAMPSKIGLASLPTRPLSNS